MLAFLQPALCLQLLHLHAQLSQITAIVRPCYSIGQLQLPEYTCQWDNRIIGRSMSYPGPIGGAVPILTSGNRATTLGHLQQQTLPRHWRKMVYNRGEKCILYFRIPQWCKATVVTP